ncbi:aldehyde dehydrogenase family protein [Burkholderia vietnamiensis]|uniref:aldehyde dehydrogenase family protein n=1 Tax=Burkholderia vietnamiensis TaxID=60552 RepID=UPI0007537D46|nr:aldehyde dehydrogenase family protein [Burkholderia vietnamiensis]KVE61158.1 aldehyde dehydrogenase [Burkholderia vietnamiensis]KVE83534.1 aldehyde dehydrogenase [Burkholderia vietnamiensis]HDR9253157.1 aldehyde dehydrogenase family protein [Burkholderia vietnamiensis]
MKIHLNVVNGKLVEAAETIESLNPATSEPLGRVPVSTKADVDAAIAAARAAQPAWMSLSDDARKAALQRVADVLKENAEYLATWITREQGKPLGGVGPDQIPGSRFEMWGCEVWTRVPASLDLPPEVVFEDATRRDVMHRQPYGVVAAVAPWNWPLLIAIWQIIPALRMGNTVVLKPSELTSICTLEMVRLIAEVLPPGVLNTVSGGGGVGGLLTSHPDVDKILFTGSTATGARISAVAAQTVTPTTMELGGNDAAIVLPDANPKEIAQGLFWGAFLNMGQTCACIKRLYVPEQLHDEVVSELKAIAEMLPMGDGLTTGVAIGPIQNRAQYDKVLALVEAARAEGGTVVCGGVAPSGVGNFYPITLVTGLKDGARLVDEEQFGPVLPIIKYGELTEAVDSANRLEVGLGASVWSSNLDRAAEVALKVRAGTVWINQHGAIHPMVPFGGIKGSGWGVEFGLEGLKSMTQPHVISAKK